MRNLLDGRVARRAGLQCLGHQGGEGPEHAGRRGHIEDGLDQYLSVLTGQERGGRLHVETLLRLLAGGLEAGDPGFESETFPCGRGLAGRGHRLVQLAK